MKKFINGTKYHKVLWGLIINPGQVLEWEADDKEVEYILSRGLDLLTGATDEPFQQVKDKEPGETALEFTVGESYRTRDGQKATVTSVSAEQQRAFPLHVWVGEKSRRFRSEGRYSATPGRDHRYDLVAPWAEPEGGVSEEIACLHRERQDIVPGIPNSLLICSLRSEVATCEHTEVTEGFMPGSGYCKTCPAKLVRSDGKWVIK